MPKGIMIVQSQPADPSCEDGYNDWYSNIHIPELLTVPGIVGARRFRRVEGGRGETEPAALAYLAIYDLDADDLTATVREVGARSADGRVTRSELIQMDPRPIVTIYEAMD